MHSLIFVHTCFCVHTYKLQVVARQKTLQSGESWNITCHEFDFYCSLPISSQSMWNRRECIGQALIKLTVFTAESSTDFNSSGLFFTASASRWMLQCVHRISGATSRIRAATLLWRPVIALAPLVETPTQFFQSNPFSCMKVFSSWNMCSAVVLVSSGWQHWIFSWAASLHSYLTYKIKLAKSEQSVVSSSWRE